MTDFNKILCDCTLSNITENFSKSYGINRLYTVASEMIYAKIQELGKYDFNLLIEWIKLNKHVWYNGKWKALKHFVYMMDDIYHNRDFPVYGKYFYFNDRSNFNHLNIKHRELLSTFLYANNLKDDKSKNYVAFFLRKLELKKIKICELTYTNIYNFIYEEKFKHSSEINFARMLNYIKRFLEYCCEINLVENVLLSFITDKRVIEFYDYICNKTIETNALSLDDSFNPSEFCVHIPLFINLLKEKGYNLHYLARIPFKIKQFALFLDVSHLAASYKTIDIFCFDILKNLISSYKESRTVLYRYFDFISGKEINFDSCYVFNEKKYDSLCPLWAKETIDEYLSYRKRLGFKNSTLDMDTNSILRLVVFLDKYGVKQFNEITPNLLYEFRDKDEHKTLEGKNAYIVHIRLFLCYLYDQKIIPNYFNSVLLEGFKLPQKIVETIDNKTLNYIYNHKDEFKTENELRSYCLFLLGVRMGLRATDAIRLERNNISFTNLTLTFTQQKTLKQLTLPMPIMVANSIYRYIKSIKHISSHKYLFQTLYAPYKVPSRNTCNKAVKIVLNKLGIDQKSFVYHSLRKTYASNIVNNSHSITDAAYALGHSDNSTVDKYLSLNQNKMKNCCMDLHLIPYGGFNV